MILWIGKLRVEITRRPRHHRWRWKIEGLGESTLRVALPVSRERGPGSAGRSIRRTQLLADKSPTSGPKGDGDAR